MTQTDEIVDPDLIHEALVVVGQMDADDAIRWLRATEDTLAMHIHREGINVASRLEEHHGLKLTDVQRGVFVRAVNCTAVAAVAAVQAAHHRLWRGMVGGSRMATIDPLMGVRRRIKLDDAPKPPADEGKRGRSQRQAVPTTGGGEITVTKLGFISCTAAREVGDDPAPLVLLTTANPNGTVRQEGLYLADGEALLLALVDGLARIGSKVASSVWPALNGDNAALDPPNPAPDPSPDDEGEEDGSQGVQA